MHETSGLTQEVVGKTVDDWSTTLQWRQSDETYKKNITTTMMGIVIQLLAEKGINMSFPLG